MTRISIFLAAILATSWLSAASAEPAALVTLARAQIRAVHPRVTAYGTVAPDPNGLSNISLPRDVIVTSVVARTGQVVRAGDPIGTARTAPNASVTYQQASSALSFAQKDLTHTRELFAEQLATNSQLAAAVKTLDDAKAALAAQRQIGAGTDSQILRAGASGIVTSVNVSRGDRVPANTTIASIATRDRLVVDLGLEPSDAARVAPGDTVDLYSPQNPSVHLKGQLQSIDGMMDPKSRLVNAVVLVNAGAARSLVLGAVLQASIALAPIRSVVVPHSALMTDGTGPYVFVVTQDRAHRKNVRITLDTGREALISRGIKAGEQVVVSGNAALEDGTHVRVH